MAPPAGTKFNIPCRFFQANRCNRGTQCRFSHDLIAAGMTAIDDGERPSCSKHSRQGMCKYIAPCPQANTCPLSHYKRCDYCYFATFGPHEERFRIEHLKSCQVVTEMAKEAKLTSGAEYEKYKASLDKICSICFDLVIKQNKRRKEKRFGIMSHCDHIFCYVCIRKWRRTQDPHVDSTKLCPQCRTLSAHVVPSYVWVEGENKQALIASYRANVAKKDCKFFKKGQGTCEFGNKCFYKHTLPNGEDFDVGPPTHPYPQPRRQRNPMEQHTLPISIFGANNQQDSYYITTNVLVDRVLHVNTAWSDSSSATTVDLDLENLDSDEDESEDWPPSDSNPTASTPPPDGDPLFGLDDVLRVSHSDIDSVFFLEEAQNNKEESSEEDNQDSYCDLEDLEKLD